jgi:hypothetical protein
MGVYEELLNNELFDYIKEKKLNVVPDKDCVALVELFPFLGTKINWSLVENKIEKIIDYRDLSGYYDFYLDIINQKRISGTIQLILDDGSINSAISGDVTVFNEILPLILEEVPGTFYICSVDDFWVINLNSEGYLYYLEL